MIMDIDAQLKQQFDIRGINSPFGAMAKEALDEIMRLRQQLPENMQDCTIVFKECSLGHGPLTATNWVQHECQTCLIESLRKQLAEIKSLQEEVRYLKCGIAEELEQKIITLEAKLAESTQDRVDAERYRFIRSQTAPVHLVFYAIKDKMDVRNHLVNGELDKAIDAAISKDK